MARLISKRLRKGRSCFERVRLPAAPKRKPNGLAAWPKAMPFQNEADLTLFPLPAGEVEIQEHTTFAPFCSPELT